MTPHLSTTREACREVYTPLNFAGLRDSEEFADVTVTSPAGQQYRCHAVLLALHSDFFRQALLSSNFREGRERRVALKFQDPPNAFPTLLDFFYTGRLCITEDNAMGLLSLSKRLLVARVQAEAREFVLDRLSPANCVAYLRQAVQCEDLELQEVCVALAAQGFHTAWQADTAGFPPSVVLDILTHPDLEVQCEEQVLVFVLQYLHSTQLPPAACRELLQQVRLAYLPHQRFAELQADPSIPRDLLAEGALARLTLMARGEGVSGWDADAGAGSGSASAMQWVVRHAHGWPSAAALAVWDRRSGGGCTEDVGAAGDSAGSGQEGPSSSGQGEATAREPELPGWSGSGPGDCPCSDNPSIPARSLSRPGGSMLPPPRASYCSSLAHGLPGGCRHLDLPCEAVWDALVDGMTVQASGVLEGRPRNLLSTEPDAFFSTNDCDHPQQQAAPWVEVHLPCNTELLSLSHYTFTHGHQRPSFYKMRSWKTQAGNASCTVPGSTFVDLDTKWETFVDLTRKGPAREQFSVAVAARHPAPPLQLDGGWRVVRLVSTGTQQDGVRRLCLRALRLHGIVRVDLLRQAEGMVVNCQLLERALAAVGQQSGNQGT